MLEAAKLDQAEAYFQSVQRIARSIEAVLIDLNALAGLALIAERCGQPAQAREWLTIVAQNPACEVPTRARVQVVLNRPASA